MGLFNWKSEKRKQEVKENAAAYEKGKEFGKQLGRMVDEFAEGRLDQITFNLLQVFKERLETVYDDPEHDPKDVAAAELRIFEEQIGEAQKRFWSELQDHLSDYLEIVDELELGELLADLFEHATEPRLVTLIAGAKVLYDSKIEEIESKQR